MHIFFSIFGRDIPAYGLLITLGTIIANVIGVVVLKKKNLDFYDFIMLEAYTLLGGIIGAKALFLIVSRNQIDWSRLLEPRYLNMLLSSGFVFYGGLIGGIATLLVGGKIQKINIEEYVINSIFLVPFIHSFGRIGCFMAGCCYGIPYEGFGAVVFPETSVGLSGVSLFPIQLVEAAFLMIISCILLLIQLKYKSRYTLEIYIFLYSVLRFFLENYRYDEARGYFVGLSTSQWISIGLFMIGLICLIYRKNGYKSNIVKD